MRKEYDFSGVYYVTKLLEEAFKEASKLPDVEQNSLAKWVLEELKSGRKWGQIK